MLPIVMPTPCQFSNSFRYFQVVSAGTPRLRPAPLLRAKDGVAYPAVLLTSGDNDGRVAPYESRKMAARLQAATSSKYPILLRTEAEAGHGIGTALSTRIQEETDVYTFLVDQLGIKGPSIRANGAQ